MAIDKDPSIFTDRSTIGSSDELDEYGVWVKSEPKDVSDVVNSENTAQMTDMLDDSFEPSLPDIEDLPDLEMDTLPETESIHESLSEPSNATVASLQDFGDLPEPEDFSVEELPQAVNSKDTFEELTSFDVVDFTSIEEGSKASEPEVENKPVIEGKKEEIGIETESFTVEGDTTNAAGTDDFTELSMDDFLDTNDFDSTSVAEQEQAEEESFDIDLEFNESVDLNMMNAETAMDIGTVSEAKDSDLNLESVSDFDDFLSDLGEASEDKSQEKSATAYENTADFNDVEAVHQELEAATVVSETLPPPKSVTPQGSTDSSVDLSTQLLMKIADELSTIKKELSTLKEELATYKNKPVTNEEAKASGEEKSKGFFDDEEDEKIALTGDELDNILNTAEFTEEAGPVITDNFEDTELLSEKEDLISDESQDVETPNSIAEAESETDISLPVDVTPEVTEVTFSEEIPSETPLEEDLGEEAIELPVDESIAELQEEGVKPIIEAPEDLEYLSEDLNEINLHSEEMHYPPQLDLSEAVIEEPDLSGVVLEEQPLEEPAIEDIHIDLDTPEGSGSEVESPISFETEPLQTIEELEDISTPIQEESFEEVLPEGFVVEAEEAEPIDNLNTPLEEEVLEAIPEETIESPQTEPEVVQPKEKIVGSPDLTQEIKAVLSYMDQLLESLPEEKIEEFAKSEYFETYKKLFEELGLV